MFVRLRDDACMSLRKSRGQSLGSRASVYGFLLTGLLKHVRIIEGVQVHFGARRIALK